MLFKEETEAEIEPSIITFIGDNSETFEKWVNHGNTYQMLSSLVINIDQNIGFLGIVSLQWCPSMISIVILLPKIQFRYRLITFN